GSDVSRSMGEGQYMRACVDVFEKVLRAERPQIVHGRSTYLISLPALVAARRCGLPFVYEVSGLWEIVLESRANAPQRKAETKRMRYLEMLTERHADRDLTLNEAMKEELIARGVEASKISLTPNCVDP